MARRLTTDRQIDRFIAKVMNEAEHHGQAVQDIIKPLSDAVRSRIDLTRDKVEVYERNGVLARTCWVTIKGKRYAFSYNYDSRCIDLKNHSIQGDLRFQFDNLTSRAKIASEVKKL